MAKKAPKNYINLDGLDKELTKGITPRRFQTLQTFWTATNVAVDDHLNYLLVIKGLIFNGRRYIYARG